MHTGMIDFGMHTNMFDERSIDHDGQILEYARLHDMTIQAWSPYQYGFFDGVFIDNPKFPELNKKMKQIADIYGVTKNAIATCVDFETSCAIPSITGNHESSAY
jgi:predicted oxidoreductase